MEMESLSFYIGVLGNIISVLVYISPLSTFFRIIKVRSTENFDSLPYVCTLLSCSLWTYLDSSSPREFLVATVSGFGVIVEATYVILFLIFAPSPMKAKTATLVGILNVGFVGVTLGVTLLALEGDARVDAIGYICAALKTVVKSKSVEYMPFWLTFFLFLSGGIWTLYAILMHDIFLGVPCGMGFLLGAAQLVLYGMYRRNAKALRNYSSDLLEQGWSNQPPIAASHEEERCNDTKGQDDT